ncbi:MAG: type VI secretion system-associated FHA domain protein TagH, partial [Lysobacterales bacterium]
EDDPFAEPVQDKHVSDDDKDFMSDLEKPLSSLADSPLAGHVSIDSLMGFDDDMDEEPESAENLKERQTPLRESFKPSKLGSSSSSPAENKGGSDTFQSAFPDEFPDDWDETTGMLRIPEPPGEDDPSGSDDSDAIPDNWDETTGMLKVPVPPVPPKAETPAPPAREAPPPRPVKQPAAAPTPAQGGSAMAAFARGAGLELSQISGFEQDVLFEQVGRMLVGFTEGLIQTLGGRTHIKSEFRLDQTMIRPVENNPFKFSTSKTRTLMQLLSKNDPAYKSGVNAISEGFDDVNAHQMAVIAGMEAALQDILSRFNPKTLEKRIVSDSILDNILPGGKKAKYWDIFKLLFDEIAGEAEDNFQQLFGKEFSRAYEEQLSRLKKARKE